MRGLGIFLVLFILLLTCVNAFPVNKVQLDSYIKDYTGTLSQEEAHIIISIADSLKKTNRAEIAVVIVDNFDGLSKEEYAITIAHESLGDTKEDNGLLVLIGLEEQAYRIEVGYGLEGDLNDAKIGRLAREQMIPSFKRGSYGEGIVKLLVSIHEELLPGEPIAAMTKYTTQNNTRYGILGLLLNNPFMFLFIFMFISRLIRGLVTKQDKQKRNDNSLFTTALFASMFFRGGSGGLNGGGFGGFGGGGFGGGGAGGGW